MAIGSKTVAASTFNWLNTVNCHQPDPLLRQVSTTTPVPDLKPFFFVTPVSDMTFPDEVMEPGAMIPNRKDRDRRMTKCGVCLIRTNRNPVHEDHSCHRRESTGSPAFQSARTCATRNFTLQTQLAFPRQAVVINHGS